MDFSFEECSFEESKQKNKGRLWRMVWTLSTTCRSSTFYYRVLKCFTIAKSISWSPCLFEWFLRFHVLVSHTQKHTQTHTQPPAHSIYCCIYLEKTSYSYKWKLMVTKIFSVVSFFFEICVYPENCQKQNPC